jgi:hypothetical protein
MPAMQKDAAPAGYSGKSLAAKLGFKPDQSAVAIFAPSNYSDLVDGAPIAIARDIPETGAYSFLHVFVRNTAELEAALPLLEPRLLAGGMLWVSWPKKSSSQFQDLTEDGVRAVALPMGLVDVKVCAVDDTWSALKLMRRKSH